MCHVGVVYFTDQNAAPNILNRQKVPCHMYISHANPNLSADPINKSIESSPQSTTMEHSYHITFF